MATAHPDGGLRTVSTLNACPVSGRKYTRDTEMVENIMSGMLNKFLK
jgi:hypothetical protein